MCVICLNTLSNDCIRPGKLSKYLIFMYPEYQSKTSDVFERKTSKQNRRTVFFDKHTHLNDKFSKASFEMALLIAKAKTCFTIGENIGLPAAIQICEIVHGDKIAEALRSILISNDIY